MAYLGKGRIAELRYITKQLGEKVTNDLKIIDLRNLIINSPNYEEEFVKEMLNIIIEKSSNELETLLKLKKHNSKTINKVKEWSTKIGEIRTEIQTSRQQKKAGKSTRLENEDYQFRLEECVVENGEDFGPSFTREGTDNGNLVILSDCEVMEAQLRNLGIENNANDDASDQEKASIQLVPVRYELYIDNTIGPLPIAPTRGKRILPDMSMLPRCHQTVTERLKRKSKKGDIKWASEFPEFLRQLEENLSTNSVLYAPDFTKRFIFQPETIFYLFSFVFKA
ncbi:UNVERIFIED_CONTAM: hypothetical protein NCL1_46270 [Trichonephila clavipes]